ncbi:hypothetical protein AAHE18_16G135200 [Arachis hypogaea]
MPPSISPSPPFELKITTRFVLECHFSCCFACRPSRRSARKAARLCLASSMGDYSNDPLMRNQNAAVQARTKAQNRANVLQLKLIGQSRPTGLTVNILNRFEPRPPLEYKPPPEKRKCPPLTELADPEYAPPKPVVETPVDINNLEEYISLVVDATVKTGITRQMEAFKAGFNQPMLRLMRMGLWNQQIMTCQV